MDGTSLQSLRDLLRARPEGLTFADLPGTVLEDLALGWSGGRRTSRVAAELAERLDGIPAETREPEIAGRALLTLLARRGAPVYVEAPADHVFLLGTAETDRGDPEGRRAFERREAEYASLARIASEYPVASYADDLAPAFRASREAPDREPEHDDAIGRDHPLALLATRLPRGLRAWFHARHGERDGDALAWKFVLVGRALAHHRNGMLETGVLRISGDAVPEQLVRGLLALDLGQLARTAVREPV